LPSLKGRTLAAGIYLYTLRFYYLICLMLSSLAVFGQAGNPFELTDRLPEEAVKDTLLAAARPTGNPFDLRPGGSNEPLAPSQAPATAPKSERSTSGPLVIQSTDPNKGKGSILAIHVILLLTLAALWLLFGNLLRQCLRGTVNDALMNQLYTRRSGGELTALWVCYIFFFLAGGFFIYLLTTYYDISLGKGIWGGWITYSLVVAAALGLKCLVLVVYAQIFPVRVEVSRYVFSIMVFSILAGLFIAPTNLLISYAPEGWRTTFIYAGMAIMVGIYGLHLLRGLFVANRLLASRPVHILLYICAIEIAPILLIYRYLTDTLA